MKTYALIGSGKIQEIIKPAFYDAESPLWVDGDQSRIGKEIPIEQRYHPDLVAAMVDITEVSPTPEANWTFDGDTFAQPSTPKPTLEEILLDNTITRNTLLDDATRGINLLQDAVDLDEATAKDLAMLKALKQYRVAVNSINLTIYEPSWPAVPGSD